MGRYSSVVVSTVAALQASYLEPKEKEERISVFKGQLEKFLSLVIVNEALVMVVLETSCSGSVTLHGALIKFALETSLLGSKRKEWVISGLVIVDNSGLAVSGFPLVHTFILNKIKN